MYTLDYATISLIVSVFSACFSGFAMFEYFQTNKNFKSDAMLKLFTILNGENVKPHKKILADKWNELKKPDKDGKPTNDVKASFKEFPTETMNVMEAYNEAGALYELNLIDRRHFRKVYGGTIVRTYNFSEDHIDWHHANGNEGYCSHFEKVATDLKKGGKLGCVFKGKFGEYLGNNCEIFAKPIVVRPYKDMST
ncbi:MAG: hypothetical protein WA799_03695 [Nitrosotalea sp.]